MKTKDPKRLRIAVYDSVEEANRADYKRLAKMTPKERLDEFAVLQERAWGEDWTTKPMVRVISWSRLTWWKEPE